MRRSLAQVYTESRQRERRSLFTGKSCDNVRGDGFAAADGVYSFVGFGFEVDFFGGDAEGLGEGFPHFGEVRAEFWFFGDDHGVYVLDREVIFVEKFAGVLKKEKAVRALPFGIGVRKMSADVTEASGAENCITQGMRQNISIGVA